MIADMFARSVRSVGNRIRAPARAELDLMDTSGWRELGFPLDDVSESVAMKLSAVNRCVEIRSDSMAKMPVYIMDKDRNHITVDDLNYLLTIRPNEAMTPSVEKKVLEINRLKGNGYEWIIRDPISRRPTELIPLPTELVEPWMDTAGRLWYNISHPTTGEPMRLHPSDIIHVKGFTSDGIKGRSVLKFAADTIKNGTAMQEFSKAFYEAGGQVPGVLSVDSALSKDKKDIVRSEWEKYHVGAKNSFRVPILDHGLKYTAITTNQTDAQFVQSTDISVQDIARFYGVPLYKLQSGKQSYSSNEQNAIEYIVSTLHPAVRQWEEERSYKLLSDRLLRDGVEIRMNMMAELRGDFASRGTWFEKMRNMGAYNVDEIRAFEDLPPVPGGDVRICSYNYGPLDDFRRLSTQRNGGNSNAQSET